MGTEDQYYDTAEYCERGHQISHGLRNQPFEHQDRCEDCGAPSLSACPACHATILGHRVIGPDETRGGGIGRRGEMQKSRPSYCRKCGEPFPWTRIALETVKRRIGETRAPEEEKAIAVEDSESLFAGSDGAQSKASRLGGFLRRHAPMAYEEVKEIMTTFAAKYAAEMSRPG